jgi:hypothetical protein
MVLIVQNDKNEKNEVNGVQTERYLLVPYVNHHHLRIHLKQFLGFFKFLILNNHLQHWNSGISTKAGLKDHE